MKTVLKEIALAMILGILLPGMILNGVVKMRGRNMDLTEETEVIFYTQPEDDSVEIRVLQSDGTVRIMDLEEYIAGVVLAEMPVSFELEALKAQAVVARTYAMRAKNGKSKHQEADVCTESSCCQAFRDIGTQQTEDAQKILDAVLDTRWVVLTYEGDLIEATYFSCSGGNTEDAAAVWGTDVPYLVATDSPGEEKASHYMDELTMPADRFLDALSLESSRPPEEWFGAVNYTAGGGIDCAEICGKTYKGTELRKLLGLKSTAILFEPQSDSVKITTRGFGHRVGMSQYGADTMALEGSDYTQILAHYYRGTVLTTLPH